MRKIQILTVLTTLALAIPFATLALIESVYLIDYARSIGGAMIGVMEWHNVALEGSVRWPELAGMIVGQLFILSILLIARRHQPDSAHDLFERDSSRSAPEQHVHNEPADPPQPV